MSRPLAMAAALGALLLPSAAASHEVLHDVERGRAVAVRAYFADGETLAYCAYEVFSPADPAIPHQKGRTDRVGWLAFVPDVPGRWRVKIVDPSGHGLDVGIEVGASDLAARSSAGPLAAGAVAFVLRPLMGIAAIIAVFVVLFVFYRRREGGR